MSETTGQVYLVGAGPGDPGLLTLRGAELLAEADLVLYDGLVNPLLLRLTHGVCERTARTRVGDGVIVPQNDINQRLVQEARAGKTVVRLKGGDPYIFGRGSEEAAALEQAGIPYEVVPGITAATAAGEYAGFSFTHRQFASAVAFVTGHEDPTRTESRLDYSALARFPGTLVFYMGLGRLSEICTQLVSHGMNDQTSAAIICRASLATQRVVSGTLANLPQLAEQAGVSPPSLVVVGDCVQQRTGLSWFEKLPLFGQRIAITRPEAQCHEIAENIARLGGQPILMPMITISDVEGGERDQLDAAIKRLQDYQWLIFTSVNGVSAFFRRLWETVGDVRDVAHLKFAAIGPATAAALEKWSLKADIVPESFRAEALAAKLLPLVAGQRCLWAGANRGRDVLPETLQTANAVVDKVVVYRNEDVAELSPSVIRTLQSGELDWVGLSSPSIAENFAALLRDAGMNLSALPFRIATISPVTSEAAQNCGLEIHAEAGSYTWNGIIDAIAQSAGLASET